MTVRPQILLEVPAEPKLVAGVPAPVRAALELASEGRVLLCARDGRTVARWRPRLAGACVEWVDASNGSAPLDQQLDAAAPLLLLSGDGVPDRESLARFLQAARSDGAPSAWRWNGRVVAAYYPKAAECAGLAPGGRTFPAEGLSSAAGRATSAPADGWAGLEDDDSVRRAEDRLCARLRSQTDGYLARLDRHLSIALSRRLVRTPVTPNQITAASLVIGLLGAALLASADYGRCVLGAALLWSCCVLDGCDGEVARLKLLSSPAGARFDVIADNVVHVAIFAAIPLHVRHARPDAAILAPAVVLMAGVLLSMFWVWWLILRRPDNARSEAARVYERIASRDFIYLVAVLAVVRRLHWFLWAAALGAHAFWASLLVLTRRHPAS